MRILTIGVFWFFFMLVSSCNQSSQEEATNEQEVFTSKKQLQEEAWQMEERYWEYVMNNDTISYKELWHESFMGYPSFGDGVSGKSGIAVWIPALHEDPNRIFNYRLINRGTNAIEDVVMVFYDTEYLWKDSLGNELSRDKVKFTHTWKKLDDTWLILGGMAAFKE